MIRSLNAKEWLDAGGKANGLNKLTRMGLDVPPGFVITYLDLENEEKILEALKDMPEGAVAVRSSADVEDHVDHSYAGQFNTFLDLNGNKEILGAIKDCRMSISDAKSMTYHVDRHGEEPIYMNVVVQQMVEGRWGGVIFSVNPVLNRHDQLLINITEGTGEALVSGETDGEQIQLYKNGPIPGDIKTDLPERLIKQLREECLLVEERFGCPIDMEFVIDHQERLWWVQARPVTALEQVHVNELDSPVDYPQNPVYTLGNVGEMMPGAITPLTWSVFGHAVEFAIQDMYKKSGVLDSFLDRPRYLKLHYGRMFFDLQAMYDFSQNVWLAKKENIDISLTGTILPTTVVEKKANKFKQFVNQVKNIRYNNSAERKLTRLVEVEGRFTVKTSEKLQTMYESLTAARKIVFDSWADHMCISANSGAMYTALLGILSGDPLKTNASHHGTATKLLGEISGIEGAEMLKKMEDFLTLIREDKPDSLAEFTSSDLVKYLENQAPEPIQETYRSFIKDYGHRGVREASLRSKDWREDREPLLDMLCARLQVDPKVTATPQAKTDYKELLKDYSAVKSRMILGLLPKVRRSIAMREQAKSLGIKIQRKLKMGYIFFGQSLTKKDLLHDSDQIFFLMHDELDQLIKDKSPSWKEIANKRRALYAEQMDLEFDHIMYSVPTPQKKFKRSSLEEGELLGTPVSLGKIEGRAFVAYSLEDCKNIKSGDILIAEITDIGWSPYFGKIGGLVTEIGSPLSHGAVVAREYGLPAIVSVKNAGAHSKQAIWFY